MSDDVTIPGDMAKGLAAWLREPSTLIPRDDRVRWADLLDPKPPSLAERVALEMSRRYACTDGFVEHYSPMAAALLAVIADDIESLPYVTVPHHIDPASGASEKAYRAEPILARLRGES